MVIREAAQKDAASIARVVVDTWRTTYNGIVPRIYLDSLSCERATSRWQERLSGVSKSWPGWFAYVAEDAGGSVIGFAGAGPSQSYGLPFTGELGCIYLLKSHQRRGIGRQLAAAAVLRLKKQGHNTMLAWVFSDNPYRAFYEALGGRPVAEREIDKYGVSLAQTAYGWRDFEMFKKKP
jgi:L-amino acid N-acyltransferase YncA